MIAAFDLWSFDDVKANADAIVGAVRSGSMPCDMEWPDDQVELLQRWIDAGTAPQGSAAPLPRARAAGNRRDPGQAQNQPRGRRTEDAAALPVVELGQRQRRERPEPVRTVALDAPPAALPSSFEASQ